MIFFKSSKELIHFDLEDLVLRMILTYIELECITNEKNTCAQCKSFPIPHELDEVRELHNTLKSILRENIKYDILAKVITLKTIMSIDTKKNEMLIFIDKSFFHSN